MIGFALVILYIFNLITFVFAWRTYIKMREADAEMLEDLECELISQAAEFNKLSKRLTALEQDGFIL